MSKLLNFIVAFFQALAKRPPVAPPTPAPQIEIFGKMSTFGGPSDKGVAPDEGLAIISDADLARTNIKSLFLPAQPPGTTGLARRLNPEASYIACRWDYSRTPKSWLRANQVTVEANNKTARAQPVDWGPAEATGRVADLSPGLARTLGLHTNDECRVLIPLPTATKSEVPSLPQKPASESKDGVPPWLEHAYELIGTKEVSGGKDNPTIVGWAKAVSDKFPDLRGYVGWYDHDSIPWCGLFVAYCMATSGFKPPQQALGAKNWFYEWQDGARLSGPALGAVMVKTRSGGGHVTFYVGEDDTYYYCLGGNQSDQVNVARILKSAGWLGFMWPKEYPQPKIGAVRRTFAEAKVATEA